MINLQELNTLDREYTDLASQTRWTPVQKERMAYLRTAIAAVRDGARLVDIDAEFHNKRSRAAGLPTTNFNESATKVLTREQEREARGWQQFINTSYEKRTMLEGNLVNQIGSYTSLGFFVPTGFRAELKRALGYADALFDPDAVTCIEADNGRLTEVPILGDIENVAELISEAAPSLPTIDYSAPGHASIGVYSFKSPAHTESMEAFQDINVDATFNAIELFNQISADRLARGIGYYFVQGGGSAVNQPQGLLTALEDLGATPVIAAGSSVNDGLGTSTGANSLGSQDFAAAVGQLNQAYLESPKVAWFMNSATLVKVRGIVTKQGSMLDLVKDDPDGYPTIFGIRVRICPSLPSIGASNTPVILGDGSYFCTKLVQDEMAGIKIYRESPGLVEQNLVQMVSFVRAGSALLYNDTNSPSPFVMLANHS